MESKAQARPPQILEVSRDYLKPAREAMQKVVALRMTQFGQAGHAGDYKPVAIGDIAKGYADGSLSTRPLVAAK